MNRRSFIMTGAWLPAAGGAWPWLAHAACASHTLAVVDTSLGAGRALSSSAMRRTIPVFETGDDVGTLWYATLAPRFAEAPGLVIGVTRASDYFVLSELALRAVGMVEHPCVSRSVQGTPVVFLLGPATAMLDAPA